MNKTLVKLFSVIVIENAFFNARYAFLSMYLPTPILYLLLIWFMPFQVGALMSIVGWPMKFNSLPKWCTFILGLFLSFCYLLSLVYHRRNMIQNWRFGNFLVSPTVFLVWSPVYHGCITDTVFGPLTNAVSLIQPLITVYHVRWHW